MRFSSIRETIRLSRTLRVGSCPHSSILQPREEAGQRQLLFPSGDKRQHKVYRPLPSPAPPVLSRRSVGAEAEGGVPIARVQKKPYMLEMSLTQ